MSGDKSQISDGEASGQAAVTPLKAPFPWFVGKSRAAHLVWPRLGRVPNYVEPFAGSLATLLRRPHAPGNEIVNDLDCYVANAWRAMAAAPEEVARFCDWPVNEADLHARHRWLHGRAEFRERMLVDPDFFDARIAGFWIWGLSCWIGDNFCRPARQNSVPKIDRFTGINAPPELPRQVPYISKPGGQGVARQVPHLSGGKGDREGCVDTRDGIWRKRPDVVHMSGRGVHQGKRPKCQRKYGIGIHQRAWDGEEKDRALAQLDNLLAWFGALQGRLRFVKVCCGDWSRVVTKAATWGQGLTGVFLDPPYDPDLCDSVYGDLHGKNVSAAVREWAIANGGNPLLRIALCGYVGEHEMPGDWSCVAWKASGGYAAAAGNHENAKKERIWFSPHCLEAEQRTLF